ncbi:tyrosine-type recombinase/integrase [Bacillus massiliglaciei]|uniref:tyrosine-type recombinase/integrase n=1 Tax=Bacillus massiliglaciei TaxID=1816693 RepID=UPI000A4531D7|nr:tyrosine-type recombinase/integrase [Bacillus massiliglaciei]
MHSENRRGKKIKGTRTAAAKRSRPYSLEVLTEKVKSAKRAKGLAESTLWRYQHAFNLLTEFLESDDARKLSIEVCRDFSSWLLHDRIKFNGHKYKKGEDKTPGLSPRTANDILKLLRTSFRFLVNEGLVVENPFEQVESIKQHEKVIEILSVDELKALLNAPNQRDYADFRDYVLMNVLIDTMARINEILSLTTSDIDLASRTITLRPEITKTRKGRFLNISKLTARLLRELMSEVAEFETEYIFLANYGEPLTSNNFRNRLINFATKAGITKRVHPHLFRHTAATLFLENGGDIRSLQIILGHSDLRMTMKYTHLSHKAITVQHEQFSALNLVMDKLNKPRKIKR